jgi:RNA polymerase sigma-70 factor (ECF subfamily)
MRTLADAMANADEQALRAILHPDVVLTVDSGGALSSALTPLSGVERTARQLAALVHSDTTVSMASINGSMGFLLIRQRTVVAAVTADVHSGRAVNVWVVCNPSKLRRWNQG